MSSRRLLRILWTLPALAAGLTCGSEKGPTQPATLEGQYKGAMAGESSPNFTASLDLTVGASTMGTIKPVGAPAINVTGTYVASTKSVAVSGGGYAITGTIDNSGNLLATYTHSAVTGTVVAYQHTTANPVTVFCGTYAGDAEGIWNPVRRGSSISGVYANVDGSDGSFTGTINGNSVSITDVAYSAGVVYIGTLSGTTMSGTWSGGGYTGTWSSNTTC